MVLSDGPCSIWSAVSWGKAAKPTLLLLSSRWVYSVSGICHSLHYYYYYCCYYYYYGYYYYYDYYYYYHYYYYYYYYSSYSYSYSYYYYYYYGIPPWCDAGRSVRGC